MASTITSPLASGWPHSPSEHLVCVCVCVCVCVREGFIYTYSPFVVVKYHYTQSGILGSWVGAVCQYRIVIVSFNVQAITIPP